MSVSEIFAPLYCGASLVLIEQDRLLPGPQFIPLLKELDILCNFYPLSLVFSLYGVVIRFWFRLDITVVKILPSALNVLDPTEELPQLRLIVAAGEPLAYDFFSLSLALI